MPWWTWIALGFFALTLLGVAVFGVWALGRVQRMLTSGEEIAARAEEVALRAEMLGERLERSSARAEDMQRRLDDLDRSVAQLGVLGWALGDVRRGAWRVRKGYLRK
jgi:hypothetical protein